VLIASTNGEHDESELVDLVLACGGQDPEALGGGRFTLENGSALLERAFSRESCTTGATRSWWSRTPVRS
jgi:hypothetical protein